MKYINNNCQAENYNAVCNNLKKQQYKSNLLANVFLLL